MTPRRPALPRRPPAPRLRAGAFALALASACAASRPPLDPIPPTDPAGDAGATDAAGAAAPAAGEQLLRREPALAALVTSLRRLAPYRFAEGATEVPEAARPLLAAHKTALREYVAAVAGAAGPEASAEAVHDALVTRLTTVGAPPPDADGPVAGELAPDFGAVRSVRVERPAEAPGWVAVAVGLALGCGVDHSLYVFAPHEGRLGLVLVDEARAPAALADGRAAYVPVLVGAGLAGGPFVLALDTPVQCASASTALRYRVLRAAADPLAPDRLLSGERAVYLGLGGGPLPFDDLAVDREGFRLEYTAHGPRAAGRPADATACRFVARFRVTADAVREMQPAPRPQRCAPIRAGGG